jgi:hypothetical protein
MDTPQGIFDELAPEVILPAQFFAAVRPGLLQRAEYRLAFAVLADGVNCFIKHCKAKSRARLELFCETRDWLMSTRSADMFSYENLCETLNIDAVKLRRALVEFVTRAGSTLLAVRPGPRPRRRRRARPVQEVMDGGQSAQMAPEPFDAYEIPHDIDAALELSA